MKPNSAQSAQTNHRLVQEPAPLSYGKSHQNLDDLQIPPRRYCRRYRQHVFVVAFGNDDSAALPLHKIAYGEPGCPFLRTCVSQTRHADSTISPRNLALLCPHPLDKETLDRGQSLCCVLGNYIGRSSNPYAQSTLFETKVDNVIEPSHFRRPKT